MTCERAGVLEVCPWPQRLPPVWRGPACPKVGGDGILQRLLGVLPSRHVEALQNLVGVGGGDAKAAATLRAEGNRHLGP